MPTMPTHSTDFLEVHEEKVRDLRRSRSGGYVDHLEELEKFERQKRDMAMKKYHDSHKAPAQSSRHPQAQRPTLQSADRLYVPTFENPGHRRVRSHGELVEKKEEPVRKDQEPARNYNVREQKPAYDLAGDAPLPTQLPVRQTWKPSQKKPSIKVEIHQDDRPSPTTPTIRMGGRPSPTAPTTRKSEAALQYQFATLQNRLSQIETICAPNLHVEAANPRDLTFSKIADEVKGYAFQLKIWGHIANVENMERIDTRKRKTVELASHTMDRLLNRVTELSEACLKARPRDLKIAPLPEVDEDPYDSYDDDDEDGGSVQDVTESLGFVIQSHLHGIQLNIQTLGRLTRSLQEASAASKDEVVAVEKLVGEVDEFFGSTEALRRHSIDTRFAGRKALEEAQYSSRQML